MSVNALYDYKFEAKDKVENFNGMQLLYVYWPNHLMFCAPFALLVQPDMSFRALDNGIDHKSMLTVTTPDLKGMAGVGY